MINKKMYRAQHTRFIAQVGDSGVYNMPSGATVLSKRNIRRITTILTRPIASGRRGGVQGNLSRVLVRADNVGGKTVGEL